MLSILNTHNNKSFVDANDCSFENKLLRVIEIETKDENKQFKGQEILQKAKALMRAHKQNEAIKLF